MQYKITQCKATLQILIRKALRTPHNSYWPLLKNPSLSVHLHFSW